MSIYSRIVLVLLPGLFTAAIPNGQTIDDLQPGISGSMVTHLDDS